MNITSLSFFFLFILSLCIYYIVPRRFRWCALLVYSAYFFWQSSQWYTAIYLVGGIVVTWLCANAMAVFQRNEDDKTTRLFLFLGLFVNLGMLAVLKYSNFVVQTINGITGLFGHPANLAKVYLEAPAGISFYTLGVVAYLVNVYWQVSAPQKRLLKTGLFVSYWPLLTSGPIIRYDDVKAELYGRNKLRYKNVTWGLQRMLWGIFLKLVISTRLGTMVDTIYGDMNTYQGLYIWLAGALFMLQLYTDFSGCMDIIIGASECYGIHLPENFHNPFFAVTIQEYWQRWHITLGLFLKDFVMYPLLRTKWIGKLTKWVKAHWGRKASKTIPTYVAMLILWFCNGLWHGGDWKYIVGEGFWFWLTILIEQTVGPFITKPLEKIGLNKEAWWWKGIQIIRVFLTVVVGNFFFRLSTTTEALTAIRLSFHGWRHGFMIGGEFANLNTDLPDLIVLIVSLVLLLIHDIMQEKQDIRERISGWVLPLRWVIWLLLIAAITIFGVYGPGYDAAAFIYGRF